MSKADKMFEELGYEIDIGDVYGLIRYNKEDNSYIRFMLLDKCVETKEILKTFEFRRKTKNYNKISLEDSQSVDIVLNYIDKLKKEIKNAEERNYSLGLDFIQIGEKLGLESFGRQAILLEIDKLQKKLSKLDLENQSLYESINCNDETSLLNLYIELKKENVELKEQVEQWKKTCLDFSDERERLLKAPYIPKDKIREVKDILGKYEHHSIQTLENEDIVSKCYEKLNQLLEEK